MLTTITLILYLIGAFILMLFMFLIARFYRIKLDHNTPIAGFFGAMIALVMGVTGVIVGNNGNGERYFVDVALFVAGAFGSWNSIALYVRMKRVYK